MADYDGPVLLFDGVCNLCNGAVRFLLAHDRSERFRFAALQSAAGKELLRRCGLDPDRLDTFVLVENGRCHVRSSAALRIARRLPMPWLLLSALLLVPRPLRDLAYRFLAARRYRWFGRRETCAVPPPDQAHRFLE